MPTKPKFYHTSQIAYTQLHKLPTKLGASQRYKEVPIKRAYIVDSSRKWLRRRSGSGTNLGARLVNQFMHLVQGNNGKDG